MRGSRLEEGWHDRERQRHDQDPRLRPTRPERSGSVVEETEATGSSGTNDAELLGAAPSRTSEIAAEAGGSPSSEAPLDHAPHQGFGRVGSHGSPLHRPKLVERVIRESNDPRGTRHVGRLQTLVSTHLPQRGEAGRKAESAGAGSARRGGSTLTTGARLVAGERVRGDRGQTSSERAAACSDREVGGFYQRKASWFRYSSSP